MNKGCTSYVGSTPTKPYQETGQISVLWFTRKALQVINKVTFWQPRNLAYLGYFENKSIDLYLPASFLIRILPSLKSISNVIFPMGPQEVTVDYRNKLCPLTWAQKVGEPKECKEQKIK